jgi:hypothetical protein
MQGDSVPRLCTPHSGSAVLSRQQQLGVPGGDWDTDGRPPSASPKLPSLGIGRALKFTQVERVTNDGATRIRCVLVPPALTDVLRTLQAWEPLGGFQQ